MRGSITNGIVEWEIGERMERMVQKFSYWDYFVFSLLLGISTIIGNIV